MPTIVTITFSPCIDKSFSVSGIVPEKKMRCTAPKTEPGGGGINVARVLKRLGANPVALYPFGGYTGEVFNQLMAKEQIPAIAVKAESETRENIIVLETATNKQFRFTMPAATLKENELQTIFTRLKGIPLIDFIVVSGRLSADISKNVFSEIKAIAIEKNARVIVDTSGEALRHAVDQGVLLVKPNVSELAQLAGKDTLQSGEIVHEAKNIISKNKCEIVVVSLNADGALLVTANESRMVRPPVVNIKSTVGAGDSMVAGIVFALAAGKDMESVLQYGVACGTAATLQPGTELSHKEDVEKLFHQIQMKPVAIVSA